MNEILIFNGLSEKREANPSTDVTLQTPFSGKRTEISVKVWHSKLPKMQSYHLLAGLEGEADGTLEKNQNSLVVNSKGNIRMRGLSGPQRFGVMLWFQTGKCDSCE